MIFQDISIHALHDLLKPHMGQPLWPGSTDPAVKQRAQEYAKQSGLWNRLSESVGPGQPLPTLRYSEYQDYFRTGSRDLYQSRLHCLYQATDDAAMALWLDHPSASVDWLADLMWQWCSSDWTMPASHGLHIELFNSRVGRMLAEYNWLFADRLEPRVKQRVADEIDKRMLDVALDWRRPDWWNTGENNWNLVCNADLVQMGLYQIQDPWALATFVHTLCRRMDYAIAYFSLDGICPEGPSYWEYGFSNFLNAAVAIKQRTGGAINLAEDEHVRKICLSPQFTQLRGSLRATIADAGNGYVSAETALKVHHMIGSDLLLRYVEPRNNGSLLMENIRTFSLFNGQRHDPTSSKIDCFAADLGYAKVDGATGTALVAVAGNNGVSHNHNDIGSFIFVIGETAVLTDPGAPVYNSQTFGPKRYEMLFCRSRGHSVPVVNAHEQSPGAQYSGTMEVDNLNGEGTKTIRMDMTGAYGDPTLGQLRRELVLESAGTLHITDTYQFNSMPTAVQEAFMTYEKPVLCESGKAVRLGDGGATLSALVPGQFTIETFTPEQHQGQDRRTVHRIAFEPAQLSREMRLAFDCRLAKS